MSLEFLLDRLDEIPATRAIAERVPGAGGRVAVGGLPGSSPAVLVAALARRLPQRLFVVVTPAPADAERWLADLQALRGGEGAVALYPQRESLGLEEPHVEIAGERVETLQALLSGAARVVVTTARASAERTAVPAALARARLDLSTGTAPDSTLSTVVQRLTEMGLERVPLVLEVAQFSVRGGILDVYGYGMAAPARIEWWADEIVSLRSFDLDTQRSGEELQHVTVLPVRSEAGAPDDEAPVRSTLLDLLPATPSWCWTRNRPSSAKWTGRGRKPRITWRSLGGWARTCRPGNSSSSHRRNGRRRCGGSGVSCRGSGPRTRSCGSRWRPPKRSTGTSTGCVRSCLAPADPHPVRQRGPARAPRGAARARARAAAGRRSRSARWTAASSCRRSGCSPTTRSSAAPAASGARGATAQAAPSAATGALAPGDYVVHLEHGIGIYRGIADDHRGRVHARGGDRRVRGRRPAQRPALPPRPARALPRRRGGRRPRRRRGSTGWAAPAGSGSARRPAQAIRADGGRSCSTSTRGGSVARGLRLPAGHPVAARARVELPLRGHARPAQGDRRGEARHGAAASDGPAARGRRRLRQDRDRGARRVQGGAGRASRSRCWCRRPFSPSSTGAPSRERLADFPVRRSRCSRGSGPRKEQKAALVAAGGRADRRRHRHPPAALQGRVVQGPRPAGRGRGAPLRREAQGAAQGAPARGRRAHADRDADSAHAAPLARRPARPDADRDAAARPLADPHVRRAVGRRAARGGVRAGARSRAARSSSCTTGSRRSTPSPPGCGALAPRARVGVAHGQMAAERARGGDAPASWRARWTSSSPP